MFSMEGGDKEVMERGGRSHHRAERMVKEKVIRKKGVWNRNKARRCSEG